MFPNKTLTQQKTWNNILKVMLEVQEAYGWSE